MVFNYLHDSQTCFDVNDSSQYESLYIITNSFSRSTRTEMLSDNRGSAEFLHMENFLKIMYDPGRVL